MDERGLSEVVEASVSEDLGTSLEPNGLGGARLVELRDDNSEGSEEGPAGMDDLNLAVLGEGGGVGREANSVPAIVTSELTSEVRGGGGGEGACLY